MLIGAMNHPQRDLFEEIEWMADMGLEFLDLTLEPPAASSWSIDPSHVRSALDRHGMRAVGHTAYYLPIGSPFEEVRLGAVAELKRCLRVFSEVGVKWMNIHPDRYAPFHTREFYLKRDLESLRELQEFGDTVGVGLMIENLPGDFNDADQLGDLLDEMPELGLHLDIGHSNLMVPANTCGQILDRYGGRLRHVHLHDNKGGSADLHMPLGSGTVDVDEQVCILKRCGYDDTITLEVFTEDPHYLAYSRDILRKAWDECVIPARETAGSRKA
jgi:sugar phosphate isomerase/epimerase